jgi:hypothetical protein
MPHSSSEVSLMQSERKLRYLRIALYIIGAFFIFGVYPMMEWIWEAAYTWTPRQHEYEQMIMGVYATLGVFLILAARDPLDHASLIWFTVWSSVVHGGIMAVQAQADETDRINLSGDVPALFLVAIVLAYLMPRTRATRVQGS